MSVKMKFGSKDIPFVYKGDKLVYPNPIKDGLLLWYDFKGMRNTDVDREVAKDLSGNGNHGTLQNFNYSTSDFSLPELYKNTKLIVKDPSDPIYSDYPNPPVGAVFNNYNPVSNKIVRGNIDMPALANTLIANMKLYHLHNDAVFLENAEIIGAYISSLMRNFSFYGVDAWVVPNRVSLIDGEWTPLYGEINTRSILQAIYALSEVLKVTGSYGSEVYQLTQTIGLMHNNIKSRVTGGELRAAMNGAVYEYIYADEDTSILVFSWGEFGISSSDMIAKAMNSYIESMGEDVIYDSQGTEFTPQQILDGAAEHIKAMYDSGVLTMEPTGLPYSFLQANSESETGVNWDWVDTQERGDTWFTNDTTLWIIEGISRLSQLTVIEGVYNIAKTYRDNFLALRELNHDSYDDKGDTRVIFYDRYNFDGSHLVNDVSISISGTALLWEIDEILSIKDGVLHSRMRDTLEAHIITNKNSDINGAFGWNANDVTSFIEMKATGEIYSSPFIQAGSSVSSGYKDNTLVFDGVDDSLTIPELELDETAMTVVHDGKLYAYEDDKVLTVGEDGEIVGGGKNLFVQKDIKNLAVSGTTANGAITSRYDYRGYYIPVKTGEIYSVARKDLANNRFDYGFSVEEPILNGVEITGGSSHRDSLKIEGIEVPEGFNYLFFYLSNQSDKIPTMRIERSPEITDLYTPAPSDYKSTSLSPTAITDLQLYNKTLHRDELLHNAKSKGLKQLKPGVIVQDGLVLHYDFSHESNTSGYKDKAFDYSGNGNHGELQNFNFTEESGYVGNKLLFDGVDDGILREITPSLEINEDITLESFLTFNQPHDLTDHYGWDWYIMCGNNQNVAEGFSLARESNGRLSFKYGGVNLVTDYNPEPNVTHHLLAKFDGDKSELSFYLDGIRISQSIRTDINPQIPRRTLGIGHATYYSSPRAAVSIGSVKIYNRALTTEEIAHNYAIEKEKFNII